MKAKRNNQSTMAYKLMAYIIVFAVMVMAQGIKVSAAGSVKMVTTAGAELKESASDSASTLGLMPAGAELEAVSNGGNGWYEVNYQGQKGYVSASKLALLDDGQALQAESVLGSGYKNEINTDVNARDVSNSINSMDSNGTSSSANNATLTNNQGDIKPNKGDTGASISDMNNKGEIKPNMSNQGELKPNMSNNGDLKPNMNNQGELKPNMNPFGDMAADSNGQQELTPNFGTGADSELTPNMSESGELKPNPGNIEPLTPEEQKELAQMMENGTAPKPQEGNVSAQEGMPGNDTVGSEENEQGLSPLPTDSNGQDRASGSETAAIKIIAGIVIVAGIVAVVLVAVNWKKISGKKHTGKKNKEKKSIDKDNDVV